MGASCLYFLFVHMLFFFLSFFFFDGGGRARIVIARRERWAPLPPPLFDDTVRFVSFFCCTYTTRPTSQPFDFVNREGKGGGGPSDSNNGGHLLVLGHA